MSILTIFGIWILLGFIVGTFVGTIIKNNSNPFDD